ncbi:hypothetical protein [Thalassobaculum sp.]|uniref:esterase/lipase family protein n=1 Tax=Thalassobaculum sp. TaxID=2022740 RepID=UPI0032EEC961
MMQNACDHQDIWTRCSGLMASLARSSIPTLGGRHFWRDVAVGHEHRIQQHVWTTHHRLLDRHDRRVASGSLEACRTTARLRFPHRTASNGTLIVMLHGLYRSRHSVHRLERQVNDAGWSTMAPNYPSGHATIAELGQWLNEFMAGIVGYDRVIFITYSLGGLVLRSAFAHGTDWMARMSVAGIVQIGTPNRGAQMAGLIRTLPPGNRISGPAARELCEPLDLPEPPPDIPVLVIAGGTSGHWGFNPILEGDNDGVVRVAETRLDRDHDFELIPTLHGLLIGHPHTELSVRSALATWGMND